MDFLSKVRWVMGISLALTIATSLGGCTPQPPPPVSIAHAITDISDDLGKFHTLGMIDLTLWTADQQEEFKKALKVEQCRQHSADPVIVMLRDNILVKLTGGFTDTGSFAVGSAGLGMPSLSMNGSHGRTTAQELDVPIYMTPLSLLADYIYLQQKDRYRSVWDEKDMSRGTTYGQSMQQSHALLQELVQDVTVTYPYNACATKIKENPSVLFGVKKR